MHVTELALAGGHGSETPPRGAHDRHPQPPDSEIDTHVPELCWWTGTLSGARDIPSSTAFHYPDSASAGRAASLSRAVLDESQRRKEPPASLPGLPRPGCPPAREP